MITLTADQLEKINLLDTLFDSLDVTQLRELVEKEKVVVEVKNIYHTPPETLLRDCTISAPPKPENYIKRSYKEKEAMLVKYAAEQTVNLSDCNKDKAALRKWKRDKEAESK